MAITNAESIEQTRAYIEKTFGGEGSGHDYAHMYRVWQLSKTIAASEADVDLTVVELGALLYDIADWKYHDGATSLLDQRLPVSGLRVLV